MTVDLTGPLPEEEEARSEFVDALFEVLCSERRRYLLHHLFASGGEAKLPELARSLAAHEEDVPRGQVTDADEKRVYNALYQAHVPKLERYGLVTYDTDSRRVELADGSCRHVCRVEGDRPASKNRYALVLATLGWCAVGLGASSLGGLFAGFADVATVAFGLAVLAFTGWFALDSYRGSGSPFAEFPG